MLITRAAISEGFDSTHIPSYGPESRGGTSYADVRVVGSMSFPRWCSLRSRRKPTGRCGRGRVTGGAREGSFEAGEQVDDIGCFEDPVALSADVA